MSQYLPPANLREPARAEDSTYRWHAPTLERQVSNETILLALICLADLVTTLYWVSRGEAREGNPVLAVFLEQGSVPFIAAKLLAFVPSLILGEWYRARNPRLVTKLLRWVIVLYLFIYVAGVAGHNGRVLDYYREFFANLLGG